MPVPGTRLTVTVTPTANGHAGANGKAHAGLNGKPTEDKTPDKLRPFVFHGVDLGKSPVSGAEHLGVCPFCGNKKLYVSAETSQWECKWCSEKGNAKSFLWAVLKHGSTGNVSDTRSLMKIADDRRLLKPESVAVWGVCVSPADGNLVCPGYGPDRKVDTLYSYRRIDGRTAWFVTPTFKHALFLPKDYDPKRKTVYVCEGLWDAAVLRETLLGLKYDATDKSRLVKTGNPAISLYADANVVAVASASTWEESWNALLAGKDVVLLYDSDHKQNPTTGQLVRAGYEGMRRTYASLAAGAEPPASVRYLGWGPDGYDPDRKSGWDLRDELTLADKADGVTPVPDLVQRGTRWLALQEKIKPVPADWGAGRSKAAVKSGSPLVEPLDCEDWHTLQQAWVKAMKWTEGLDRALSVMLATAASTMLPGDQTWVRVISPPSSGKSSLCEALAVAREYVISKSTLRGFHSGYDAGDGENHSPLGVMLDKTLVIKDGDTLLTAPNRDQILAEARDVYDRVSRSSFRNSKSKDWEGVNLTILLCGTAGLRALDTSELGERFLTCTIMEGIDDELEDAILGRTAMRALAALRAPRASETGEDAAMLLAKRLTGGYVRHLRRIAPEAAAAVGVSPPTLHRITRLAKYVAYMRARPSKKQTEAAEREFGTRLTTQLLRLAVCLAVVLNKDEVDEQVMDRVRRCALDTARGTTQELMDDLVARGVQGRQAGPLAVVLNRDEEEVRRLLKFLRQIGAVEQFKDVGPTGKPVGLAKWRPTAVLRKLHSEAVAGYVHKKG